LFGPPVGDAGRGSADVDAGADTAATSAPPSVRSLDKTTNAPMTPIRASTAATPAPTIHPRLPAAAASGDSDRAVPVRACAGAGEGSRALADPGPGPDAAGIVNRWPHALHLPLLPAKASLTVNRLPQFSHAKVMDMSRDPI
jgi:hypothetical protein